MGSIRIEDLAVRLALLEHDVAAIKGALWPPVPPAPATWGTVPAPYPAPRAAPRAASWAPSGTPSGPPRPKPGPGLSGTTEAKLAGTWFARAGALAFLLGASFAFKYGVDQGFITRGVRVLIGLAVGLAFITWGAWAKQRSWERLAQAVTAGGIAIAYLSVLVAHSGYQLISGPLALAALVVIALGNGALSWRYDSLALAVMATVLAFLNPLLALSGGHPSLSMLAAYLVVVGAATMTAAVSKHWLPLAILGAVLGALTPLVIAGVLGQGSPPPAAVLYPYAALYAVGLLATALHRRWWALEWVAMAGTWLLLSAGLSQRGLWLGMSVTTAFLALFVAVPFAHHHISAQQAAKRDGLVLALNATIHFLAAMVLVRRYPDARGPLIAVLALGYAGAALLAWSVHPGDLLLRRSLAGISAAGVTLALALQFHGLALATGWGAEGLALTAIASRGRSHTARLAGAAASGLGLLAVVASLAAGLYHPTHVLLSMASLQMAVQVALLSASAYLLSRDADPQVRRIWYPVAATTANALAVVWLSAEAVVRFPAQSAPEPLWQALQFSLSSIWGLYAAGLLIAGIAAKWRWARLAAVALLGLTVVKMLVVDLWTLTTGQRVLGFIGLGVVLLGCSVLYHRFKELIL